MKKIAFNLLIIISLIVIYPICVGAVSIETGDYAYFGKYGGDPVLWRCIGVDDNGAFMVCENIISLKSFDAASNGTEDRNLKGSNRWSTSALRKWLNSTETTVDYSTGSIPEDKNVFLGENGYSGEAGFLSASNFTPDEVFLMKDATIKTFVSRLDSAEADGGESAYLLPNDFAVLGSNSETAYYEYTTDKMFLLSTEEMAKMSELFGRKSFYVNPTAYCVEQNNYSSSLLSTDKSWLWWFRDPLTTDSGVRTACASAVDKKTDRGWLSAEYAYNDGIGVRPAFYMDVGGVSLSGGDGSYNSPYYAGTSPTIHLSSLVKTARIGEKVPITIETHNMPSDVKTGIIANGVFYPDFKSGNLYQIDKNENIITAVIYKDGTIIAESSELILCGVDLHITDEMENISFDNWEDGDFTVISGDLTESEQGILTSNNGYTLYFPRTFNISNGVLEVSYDIMCESSKYTKILLEGDVLSVYTENGWISPYTFSSGYIYCGSSRVTDRLPNGEYKTLTIRYDFTRNVASLALNGQYVSADVAIPDVSDAPVTIIKMSVQNPNCTVNIKNLNADLSNDKFIVAKDVSAYPAQDGTKICVHIDKYCGSGKLKLITAILDDGKMLDLQFTDVSLSSEKETADFEVHHPEIAYKKQYTFKAFLTYPDNFLDHVAYLN